MTGQLWLYPHPGPGLLSTYDSHWNCKGVQPSSGNGNIRKYEDCVSVYAVLVLSSVKLSNSLFLLVEGRGAFCLTHWCQQNPCSHFQGFQSCATGRTRHIICFCIQFIINISSCFSPASDGRLKRLKRKRSKCRNDVLNCWCLSQAVTGACRACVGCSGALSRGQSCKDYPGNKYPH